MKKSQKTLCTIYPRENYFTIMVVIGKKEKDSFEQILPTLHSNIQNIYANTQEGNGQKWLICTCPQLAMSHEKRPQCDIITHMNILLLVLHNI